MVVVKEHMKWRRHRNHPISDSDPTPQQIPSIIQSTRCKSTLSSLIISTFSNNNNTNETTHSSGHNNRKKKNNNNNSNNNGNSNFSASTFRGLGCTAGSSQQVSVPAMIRSSADWQENKKSRKNNKNKKNKNRRRNSEKSNRSCHNGVVVVDGSSSSSSATCVDFQDVWCGPGMGFSVSDAAPSVDCVVARRNVSSRGKLDSVERVSHRERPPPYLGRRTVNTGFSFLDDDPDIFAAHPGSESFAAGRYYRHIPHPSPDGLAEIMILQERLLMGGRLNSHDQFSEWRLDVDNMSYEQLLELGERIGYVNTGLKEDEMGHNIRKIKHVISHDTLKLQTEKKCSICQEEYEGDDEIGRLNCEHYYHFQCIKQWLVHKNFCPVCKQEVVVRH